jgi:hypothetical protein
MGGTNDLSSQTLQSFTALGSFRLSIALVLP